MIPLAPRWALSAYAQPALDDPHMAPGVHLRVFSSPSLGLPNAPFQVYRVPVATHWPGDDATGGPYGSLSEGRTQAGATVTWPYHVSGNTKVTVRLPAPPAGLCGWVRVEGTPGLNVDAMASSSQHGPAVFSHSRVAPYVVTAPRIDHIVISGTGDVTGIRWLNPSAVLNAFPLGSLFRSLALPVPAGPRYAGIANPDPPSLDRVRRGAPRRRGLHEAPTAATPETAPASTPQEERDRVEELSPDLKAWVTDMVNDTSATPWTRVRDVPLKNKPNESITVEVLGAIFQALLDRGLASRLGYADVDEAPPGIDPGRAIAYVIRGSFARANVQSLGARVASLHTAAPELSAAASANPPSIVLWTVAFVSLDAGPSGPLQVLPGTPEPGEFLPHAPPAAERELRLPISRGVPVGTLAFARKRAAEAWEGLNPRTPTGRAMTLAVESSNGLIADRHAPPEALQYRIAQADMFGRWSQWAQLSAPAKPRPKPPRPTLQLFYTPPAAKADDTTARTGTLSVRVPVPKPRSLEPGSLPLQVLKVQVELIEPAGAMLSASVGITDPLNPPAHVEALLDGPAVTPAGTQLVRVTATWGSGAGFSPPSAPLERTLFDPRPPPAPALLSTLRYSARPDAAGLARVSLAWSATATQKQFRVYYTDETRVCAWLGDMPANDPHRSQADQARTAWRNAGDDVVARAAVLTAHAALFTREVFELLTPRPIDRPSFQHAVSGALRVLSFYRVVAMGEGQVESTFAGSALVPVAVPNTAPPALPLLAAAPRQPGDPETRARLRLTVPKSTTPAARYRLRRSPLDTDTLRMPIAQVGIVSSRRPDGTQEAEIVDDGPLTVDAAARLRPFQTYHFRVEVQAPDEPTGDPTLPAVAGAWSAASAPVSVTVIPPEAPRPAQAVVAARVGNAVEITVKHAEPLVGGTVGPYRIELYRRLPKERSEQRCKLPLQALGFSAGEQAYGWKWLDAGAPARPDGTSYRVVIIDPTGRPSRPSPFARLGV